MTERDAKIIELLTRRPELTHREVAPAFGITACRVQQIAARAGLLRDRRLREDEKATIRSLYKRGMLLAHIAHDVCRDELTVRSHLIAAGLHQPKKKDPPWSAADADLVRRQYRNVSARALAQQLGRTRNEVIGKARRLKLHEARAS